MRVKGHSIPLLPDKIYEHLWPVFALIIDTKLSRESLKKAYARARPGLTMALGLAIYLGYATCWETYSKAVKGSKVLLPLNSGIIVVCLRRPSVVLPIARVGLR